MKFKIIFLLLVALWNVGCDHLLVGNVSNGVKIVHNEYVEYSAIPFLKRVKYFFYSLPANKKIQGIQALDKLLSKSTIDITAGGVGYSFANLRMNSEQGCGLSYNIRIYVSPDFEYSLN